jgi:hypothetical protein
MSGEQRTLLSEVGTEWPIDLDKLREAFRDGKSDKIDSPWSVVQLVTWSDDVGAWILTSKGSDLLAKDAASYRRLLDRSVASMLAGCWDMPR